MEFLLILGSGFLLYLAIKSFGQSSDAEQSYSHDTNNYKKSHQQPSTSRQNRVSSNSDDSDDFATFTTTYGSEETKSKNKTLGRWIQAGEAVNIKGYTITKGKFYFGGRLASLAESFGHESASHYETGAEAALFDDSLSVINAPLTYEDESLGYWPKYNSISAKCRGALLSWLSSERNDPATPLGYVFIYFYGIERRVFVDSVTGGVDDTEFKALFEEVVRLKDIYDSSWSFLGYATRLMEMMCLLRPSVLSDAQLENNPRQDSILLKTNLAKTVKGKEPIPADLALAWLKFSPDYHFRQPARRCAYEFSQMFNRLYKKKYNEGIVVKPNQARLKIEYLPASSSLRGITISHEDLPDPSGLKGPINQLADIADKCTEALDAYSRYLGKSETSRTDIAAVLLLPEELSDIGATLGLSKFKKWAESCVENENGLADFSDFWQFTKKPLPTKITKKETELMQLLAEKAGFGLVPDTRYHHAKPSIDSKLVLFSEGHGKNFEPSQAFNEMGMTLRLGAMVAAIDLHLDQTEVALLKQLIDHDNKLSPTEKRSLHAYLIWRLNTASNATGLKTQLAKLGPKEKAAVSRILISVALADGKIHPEEVKQIEKLYTLLGLDKSLVTGDIHAGKAATVHSTSKTKASSAEAPKGFQLDESVLAIHESQTKDVQNMLSAIFLDEEPVEETPVSEEYDTDIEDIGIDAQHRALYESLITQDKWSRGEVDELCKKLGLMTNGAIETINDWSFERVDAPVLEEDVDDVYIDQEIVDELEG